MRALRVLVVDDQELIRAVLGETLSADGHTVDPAPDGVVALQLLDQQAYDLVMSDLRMPQVDGPTLYQEARKRRPDAVPQFVFITGEDEAPAYGRFLVETKAPVTKPFKLKEFRALLATLFPSA